MRNKIVDYIQTLGLKVMFLSFLISVISLIIGLWVASISLFDVSYSDRMLDETMGIWWRVSVYGMLTSISLFILLFIPRFFRKENY